MLANNALQQLSQTKNYLCNIQRYSAGHYIQVQAFMLVLWSINI